MCVNKVFAKILPAGELLSTAWWAGEDFSVTLNRVKLRVLRVTTECKMYLLIPTREVYIVFHDPEAKGLPLRHQ